MGSGCGVGVVLGGLVDRGGHLDLREGEVMGSNGGAGDQGVV